MRAWRLRLLNQGRLRDHRNSLLLLDFLLALLSDARWRAAILSRAQRFASNRTCE